MLRIWGDSASVLREHGHSPLKNVSVHRWREFTYNIKKKEEIVEQAPQEEPNPLMRKKKTPEELAAEAEQEDLDDFTTYDGQNILHIACGVRSRKPEQPPPTTDALTGRAVNKMAAMARVHSTMRSSSSSSCE
uniref:Uncharacterized protein n=1 Tax=Anopheles dirus TaxID=7168 RepID=A0A182NSJ2_9DIPT